MSKHHLSFAQILFWSKIQGLLRSFQLSTKVGQSRSNLRFRSYWKYSICTATKLSCIINYNEEKVRPHPTLIAWLRSEPRLLLRAKPSSVILTMKGTRKLFTIWRTMKCPRLCGRLSRKWRREKRCESWSNNQQKQTTTCLIQTKSSASNGSNCLK